MSARSYPTSMISQSADSRMPASTAPRRRWRTIAFASFLGLMALSQVPTTTLADSYGSYDRR